MHLVGRTIRIYYDAHTYEGQIYIYYLKEKWQLLSSLFSLQSKTGGLSIVRGIKMHCAILKFKCVCVCVCVCVCLSVVCSFHNPNLLNQLGDNHDICYFHLFVTVTKNNTAESTKQG